MKKINVYDMEGNIIAEESLAEEIVKHPVNRDVIYYYVNAHRANMRQGNASTKTRGEVSGGGKKPWRQKGTGRARVGSSRNPVWRHGGVAFGPKPRDYSQRLQKKVKRQALREVLKNKIQKDRFALLVPGDAEQPKTSIFANFLKKSGYNQEKILFVFANDKEKNRNLVKSLRNIASVSYDFSNQLNPYAVLKADVVIAEKNIFDEIKGYLGE